MVFFSNEWCLFVQKKKNISASLQSPFFKFVFVFYAVGVKVHFGGKPLIMYAKIQIFKIEGKNLKKKLPL